MIISSSRRDLIFGWILILLHEVLLDPQNMTLIVLFGESFSEFRLLNNDDVIELVKKCAKYRAL